MPKRGESATPAQRAALKRGQEKRKEQWASKPGESQRARWAMLLDGSLTVRDLSDEEIKRMRVGSANGAFVGKKRQLPSHLAQQFHQEAIRRANDRIRTAAPEAVKALLEIGSDPDVKDSDRIKALLYIIDRSLGKTPEVVRVEGANPWDDAVAKAAGVDLDRNLADLAGEASTDDADA